MLPARRSCQVSSRATPAWSMPSVPASGASASATRSSVHLRRESIHDGGAGECVDEVNSDVVAVVRRSHPGGIAGIIDLAATPKDAPTRLAGLVRAGGSVVSRGNQADV